MEDMCSNSQTSFRSMIGVIFVLSSSLDLYSNFSPQIMDGSYEMPDEISDDLQE